ncbi:hypothetical protein CI238_02565 [Colletotrichum incanum]|uniref:Uncharacterized protein n=1 Tax=Colletotrichum incanum TaxID=1573173 RepID=A0A161Y278_COLIC|nr:hypothetical protein CI238_02565 [Colletotrichum incanum]
MAQLASASDCCGSDGMKAFERLARLKTVIARPESSESAIQGDSVVQKVDSGQDGDACQLGLVNLWLLRVALKRGEQFNIIMSCRC